MSGFAWRDYLERIVETIAESILVIDKDGLIVYANASAETVLGVKRSNLIGASYSEPGYSVTTLDGKPFPVEKRPFTRALQTGKMVRNVEYVVVHPDGSQVIVSVNATPLRNDQGEIVGITLSFIDITAQEEADVELKASEKILRNITSVLGEGVYVLDEDDRLTFMNPEAEHLLGWTESELLGKAMHDTIHFQKADGTPLPADECPVLEVTRAGNVYRTEEDVFTRKDGRMFPVAYVCTPIIENGEVVGSVTAFQDITERKRVQEVLRESEAKFRTLVEQIPAITYVAALDLASTTLYVSPQIEEILGYSETEYKTDPDFWRKHLYPDDYARVMEDLAKSHASGSPFLAEYRMFTHDGAVKWLRDEAVIVRDDVGKPLFLQGVMFDITESRKAKQLSDALNDINSVINSTLDFDEIMQKMVVESAKAIGAETAAIDTYEDRKWVTKYIYGFPAEVIGVVLTDEEAPHAMLAAKTRRSVVINDALNDARVNRKTMERFNIKSVLVTPLIIRNEVIGTLFFNYHSAPKPFTDAEVDFASKVAASVSLALQNARLYEAERHIADTLQESLLIMSQRIEGITFGYLYRSATEATRIGGDFYDLFEMESGKIGIIIGDVSGKGIEAAALTSMVRNTIKAHAYEDGTPAIIMAKTNDVLVKTSPPSIFMTAFLGMLDLDKDKLTYCSAGHPPAIIKRGASVELLGRHSPIIGGFPGMHYRSSKATLKKGDMLILYTDGITEARHNEDFFGEERLVSFLKDLQPMPAEEVLGALFNYVMDYTGGKLSDDIAVLVVSPGV